MSRETEWELQEVCKREGLGILPWSPLKGGWLSGKITREGAPEGSRVQVFEDQKAYLSMKVMLHRRRLGRPLIL
jgi:aryl-alcohol dehydrogenase-like predicted oxidoreductase